MSLSHREERTANKRQTARCEISITKIAESLKSNCPYIDFAYILGSGNRGFVPTGSDIDIAIHFSTQIKADWDKISTAISAVENIYPKLECDIGILNSAGPTYRFEAIKGKLLFVREDKIAEYAEFYSISCRDHEEMMASYRRFHLIAKEYQHA